MAVADLTLEGLIHDLNNVFQTIGESEARGSRAAFLKRTAPPPTLLPSSKMRPNFAWIIWNAPTALGSNSHTKSIPRFT
jgi:hypothetical protein